MNIPYFFGAAAGGFVLMAAVGIQALVALFSSIPRPSAATRRIAPSTSSGPTAVSSRSLWWSWCWWA